MENCRKMVLMPYEAIKPKDNFPKDFLNRVITISLKLAKIAGYDLNGHILDSEGNYLSNTNIELLLINAFTKDKEIPQVFAELLFKADVSPDLIVNSKLKESLVELYNRPRPKIIRSAPKKTVMNTAVEPSIKKVKQSQIPLSQAKNIYKKEITKPQTFINQPIALHHIRNWDIPLPDDD